MMDSSRREGSKSWSDEEIDQPDNSGDYNGIGRSYECVFCKRGFTTAQALGGHMNIHRKERAKPNLSSNRSLDDYYAAVPGIYLPTIPNYVRNYNPFAHGTQIVYNPINSPSSSQGVRSIISRDDLANGSRVHQFPQGFNGYIKEKHYGGLSLRLGPASAEETQAKRQRCSIEEDEEMDLELRLGHDP